MQVLLTDFHLATQCPETGEAFLWDSKEPGLGLRLRSGGSRTFVLQYRLPGGRTAQQRRISLGRAGASGGLSLGEARKMARQKRSQVDLGGDPQAEARAEAAKQRARLTPLLEEYERDLRRRKVVNVVSIMSTLRRGLARINGRDLATVTRADFVGCVTSIADAGKAGAAADLRAKAMTLLNFAVNRGVLQANPLAGLRMERATRAERIGRPGRILSDHELVVVWRAAGELGGAYGALVQTLIVTGQRRGETAKMLRAHRDLTAAVWTIPATDTKNGRTHRVPVPSMLAHLLAAVSEDVGNPLVFVGRAGRPISGFSDYLGHLRALLPPDMETFGLHDLRRTFRSGLTRLGVAEDLAELMLNHARADLLERYDREERWPARVEAADRWANHVANLLPAPAAVAGQCRNARKELTRPRRGPPQWMVRCAIRHMVRRHGDAPPPTTIVELEKCFAATCQQLPDLLLLEGGIAVGAAHMAEPLASRARRLKLGQTGAGARNGLRLLLRQVTAGGAQALLEGSDSGLPPAWQWPLIAQRPGRPPAKRNALGKRQI